MGMNHSLKVDLQSRTMEITLPQKVQIGKVIVRDTKGEYITTFYPESVYELWDAFIKQLEGNKGGL